MSTRCFAVGCKPCLSALTRCFLGVRRLLRRASEVRTLFYQMSGCQHIVPPCHLAGTGFLQIARVKKVGRHHGASRLTERAASLPGHASHGELLFRAGLHAADIAKRADGLTVRCRPRRGRGVLLQPLAQRGPAGPQTPGELLEPVLCRAPAYSVRRGLRSRADGLVGPHRWRGALVRLIVRTAVHVLLPAGGIDAHPPESKRGRVLRHTHGNQPQRPKRVPGATLGWHDCHGRHYPDDR